MKKIIKNNIFGFIIGGIIFGGIGVGAYIIQSNEISYIPTDNSFDVSNVKEALDKLYDTSNKSKITTINDVSNVSSLTTMQTITFDAQENNLYLLVNYVGSNGYGAGVVLADNPTTSDYWEISNAESIGTAKFFNVWSSSYGGLVSTKIIKASSDGSVTASLRTKSSYTSSIYVYSLE